mmetsp:Transcript_34040/g.81827  ORF Transcript_34040/g.81827 Transcript_34040/m.81827 type:complete len:101 (-) Transcript_34040:128-430(-)
MIVDANNIRRGPKTRTHFSTTTVAQIIKQSNILLGLKDANENIKDDDGGGDDDDDHPAFWSWVRLSASLLFLFVVLQQEQRRLSQALCWANDSKQDVPRM